MVPTFQTLILLPLGLGLIGFIEPCTIGGHLLFLDTQRDRSRVEKIRAVLVFVAARVLVTGSFGALVGFFGQWLISLQTGFWLIFGLIYLAIGGLFLLGRGGLIRLRMEFAPTALKHARSPLLLGLAFGFNIPACAAPILFALLGLAATAGTVVAGLLMMSLFGLALSLPLVIFAALPKLAIWLDGLGRKMSGMRWVIGPVFVLLGIWSVWFGLFVDP